MNIRNLITQRRQDAKEEFSMYNKNSLGIETYIRDIRLIRGRFFVLTLLIALCSLFITSCPNPWMKEILGVSEITFNANGGSPTPAKQYPWRDELIKQPANPTKANYNFAGWYTDNNTFENLWDFNVSPTVDMTLYARWVPGAVGAQQPNITAHPLSAGYTPGDTPTELSVTATVTDGGTLTYQWYSNTENNTTSGIEISGETSTTYQPPTSLIDPTYNYYYVVVTNTIDDNGDGGNKTAARVSNVAVITFSTVPIITFNNSTLANGTVDTAYSQAIPVATITNSGTITYTLVGGNNSLPAGLTFNASTRVLSGTPTTAVTNHTFQITASSAGAADVTATFTITIEVGDIPDLSTSSVWVQQGSTYTPYTNLKNALDAIITNGTYTVFIGDNQNLEPYPLTVTGADITLTSTNTTERIIQLTSAGRLLTVNSGVTLRFGNGITLQGINTNNASLIHVDGGNLFMNGTAKIRGNTTTTNGSGVQVINGGQFTMSGGTITENTANQGGGVRVANVNSIFTMTGGDIIGNTATGTAGGVAIGTDGMFIMNNGSISNNNAGTQSGGVNAWGGFIMNGGEINGNISTGAAGGVGVSTGATFTMNSGTISNNNAGSDGGGLYAWGEFVLHDGIISSNTAERSGGGVFVGSNATFTMTGGEIISNRSNSVGDASQGGGGVFSRGGIFHMTGGIITSNTAGSFGGGVMLSSTLSPFTKTGNSIITGFNAVNEPNGNSLFYTADAGNRGLAVFIMGGRRRTSTAGEGVDLNAAIAGGAGGWDY